jgi:hypothetical protein
VALLAEGGAIAAQFSRLLSTATSGTLGAIDFAGNQKPEDVDREANPINIDAGAV